jgi:branched-chain amino acid transport system permease protein
MQILANGLVSGLTIAVLAVAFSVVYLPTRVFHIALGGIYAAAPFVAWALVQAGWPWPIATLVAVVVAVVLSLACEQFNHALLEKKNAPLAAHLIASLGLYIIFVQTIALIWGNQKKNLSVGIADGTTFGSVTLTHPQILAAVVSTIALLGFYAWLHFSNLGVQFRALADNTEELALRGYNIRRLRLLAFGVSGLLGAVSALLTAYDTGFDPHAGLSALLVAIVAVIIGGRHSFVGPIVGGILIGIVRSEVVWFLSAQWQEAITFGLLALFLYVRPNGLVGRETRLEAEA